MKHKYIAIEGNIGVGKTTVSKLLADKFDAQLILENFEENHFLNLFYKYPKRYAFHTEVSFLIQRYEQLLSIETTQENIIADYFFMKTLIFAKNNLSQKEFDLFETIFNNLKKSLRKPDLIVLLRRPVPALLENIRRRGREFEMHILPGYLSKIEEEYDFFFKNEGGNLKILSLEIKTLDFITNLEKLTVLKEKLTQDYPYGITQISI